MKFMIVSDLHGSAAATKLALQRFEEEQADYLVLLGDILNHGPRNALPEEYDPQQVAALLNAHRKVIIAVKGNCDSEVDEQLLQFPLYPQFFLMSKEKRVFLTHGHIYNEANLPPLQSLDILIHGHFHISNLKRIDGLIIASPGSLSIPKMSSKPAYLLLEEGRLYLKDAKGIVFDQI